MAAVGETGFRRPDPSQCAAPIIFVAREAPACRGRWRRKGLLCRAFSVASWTWAKKGAAAACKMTPTIFPQLERDAFGVPFSLSKKWLAPLFRGFPSSLAPTARPGSYAEKPLLRKAFCGFAVHAAKSDYSLRGLRPPNPQGFFDRLTSGIMPLVFFAPHSGAGIARPAAQC